MGIFCAGYLLIYTRIKNRTVAKSGSKIVVHALLDDLLLFCNLQPYYSNQYEEQENKFIYLLKSPPQQKTRLVPCSTRKSLGPIKFFQGCRFHESFD